MKKKIYNTDSKTPASKWVREEIKTIKTNSELIQLQNPTNVNVKYKNSGAYIKNSIGYFYCGANNIDRNTQNVGMWSVGFYAGHGLSVVKNNFYKAISLFTARKTIKPNWLNSKDEYLAPNESHSKFEQFKYDSLVYSLFESKSNQSSLRQIKYKGKLWDIKNEFFWRKIY